MAVRTYEIFIDVVDNGYYATIREAKGGDHENSISCVFNTAYHLGQWIDSQMPRPSGQTRVSIPDAYVGDYAPVTADPAVYTSDRSHDE